MDTFEFFMRRRPWVNGNAFIGPSLESLLLAYYISQGEQPPNAQKFAEAHMKALRDIYPQR